MTREEMSKALAKGICTVIFEKANGEERTMHCTTNIQFMPKEKQPKGTGINRTDEVISVFDTTKADWRSFRIDSVKEFKV